MPVVTSKKGSLVERIEHGVDGFLIDGEPRDEAYKKEFIATTVRLLQDEDLWNRISEAAIKRASRQTYTNLARNWQNDFEARLKNIKTCTMPVVPELQPVEVRFPQKQDLKINIDTPTLKQLLRQAIASFGF